MVVVVDLVSKFGFRFLFLGCISVIWHSQIQVMEVASFFFSFFFFFKFLGLCSWILVCFLVVLVQDTLRSQFLLFLVFNSVFNFFLFC